MALVDRFPLARGFDSSVLRPKGGSIAPSDLGKGPHSEIFFGSHKDSNEPRNPEEQPPTGSTLIPPKQPEDPFCPDRFSNIIMLGSCVHIENSSMFISRDGLVQYLQAHIDTDALANNEKC